MRYYFHSIFNGIILIAIGLLIWLSNIGLLHITWRRDWPVIIIAIGVIGLIKHIIKR